MRWRRLRRLMGQRGFCVRWGTHYRACRASMLVTSRKEEKPYQAIIHQEKLKFIRRNQATKTGKVIRKSRRMDLSTPVSPTMTPVSRAHRYPQLTFALVCRHACADECFRTHLLPHTNICLHQSADANTYTFIREYRPHLWPHRTEAPRLCRPLCSHAQYRPIGEPGGACTHEDIQCGAVDGTGPHSCLTHALDLACIWSLQAAQLYA